MISWLKRVAAPIAAIAFLGTATLAANADTVQFFVEGHFTSGGTGAAVGSPDNLLNSTVSPGLTLTYNGGTVTESAFIPGITEATTFGNFTSNTTGSQLAAFNNAGFKLNIFQIFPDNDANPNNDGGQFVGSLSGAIFFTADGSLTLNFSTPLDIILPAGQTAYPPAVLYHVDASQSIDISDGGVIRGSISAVPLPGVALAGMALMGCVGGLRKARNRAEEPAVA